MMASFRLLLLITGLTLTLGGAMASDEFELSAASNYIVITPASGAAPLAATLLAKGMELTAFLFWELDWDGNGQEDIMGQGSPFQKVTYSLPGNYFPVFNFYNDRNELIAQASGSITVTDQLSSMPEDAPFRDNNIAHLSEGTALPMQDISPEQAQGDTGSQSQALTASPGGWGIISDTPKSGDRRPVENLSDEPNGWSPPREEFTEYLKPQLYASVERGPAPLKVTFDASGTFSRYGVMRFNYDVAWGPHEAEDDGYYLYSGTNPQWTHTFEEYGMYLLILDVEDNSGKSARVTKVIFVL